MSEYVHAGDAVIIQMVFGWDTGISNNSARAVIADVLAQNGLMLESYNPPGFFGGNSTMLVRAAASDYADKQDVAGAVAGIIQGQLGLSVSNAVATGVVSGTLNNELATLNDQAAAAQADVARSRQLMIDAQNAEAAARAAAGTNQVYDAGLLATIDVPIPKDAAPVQTSPWVYVGIAAAVIIGIKAFSDG